MRIDILDKLFERLDIWSSLVDPQFSVPDSRFSNLDFRSSIHDSRSLIPESFGIENRVSSRDCHQRTYERTTVYQREINYI